MVIQQSSIKIFMYCLIVFLFCLSCSSNGNEDPAPATAPKPPEPVLQDSIPAQPIESSSLTAEYPTAPTLNWAKEYDDFMNLAGSIENTSANLPVKAEELLNAMPPTDANTPDRLMMVAVVGAVAYYWEDNPEKAKAMAVRAFQYRGDRTIEFPENWQISAWLKSRSYENVKKLVQAKDFVVSSANAGHASFKEGNQAFIAQSKFMEGLEMYKKALSQGIEDTELRHAAYARLAACLFKAQRHDEAEETFLHGWLLDHSIALDFGDQETRDFLEGLAAKHPED